jgi:hypothetical protein
MRLPVIKHTVAFIEENDEDFVIETMDVLEHLIEAPGIKDEELDVIGELLSNLSGALEVKEAMRSGKTQREALNEFMQRVVGSIDQ